MTEKTPTVSPGKAVLSTLFTVFLHSWVPVGLGIFLTFGAPRFEAQFADADATLPQLTARVFALSQTFRVSWIKITVLVGLLLAIDGVIFFVMRRSLGAVAASIWSGLIILGEVALAAICVVSVFLPFSNLEEETAATPVRTERSHELRE